MPSSRTSSSSSTDGPPTGARVLEPGYELAGFRIERVIGSGSLGIVYEATQLSLDRRVALKVIPPDRELAERVRRLEWPEHPHVVGLYAAGACERGEFVAMRLVRGTTLATAGDRGRLGADRALEILAEVAGALDAAHERGIVHGALSARNVFLDSDGTALLSDLGLGPRDATRASDLAAFEELARGLLGDWAEPPDAAPPASAAAVLARAAETVPSAAPRGQRGAPGRWAVCALLAGVLAIVATALALILGGSGSKPTAERAPPVENGAIALGSGLSARGVRSVDCNGQALGGASPACTVLQMRLPGRRVSAASGGAIRRWVVRGARGELSLQVLRPNGNRLELIARSDATEIRDEGVHAVPADLPVRRGDLVGLDVAPGSGIGIRRGVGEARVGRWLGEANPSFQASLPTRRGLETALRGEMSLRVEYVPGARPRLPGRLTGRSAERAPPGRRQGSVELDLGGGVVRKVSAVELGRRGVALDLFAGSRRLERLAVPDADPRGRILDLVSFGNPSVRLRWRNPDGRVVSRDYAVAMSSLTPR